MTKVDVFVVFTPLCRIECEHFEFHPKAPKDNIECAHRGGVREDLDETRITGDKPEGCPHFPQEIIKKNLHMLDFHQAFGTLCYKSTGRYEGTYVGVCPRV